MKIHVNQLINLVEEAPSFECGVCWSQKTPWRANRSIQYNPLLYSSSYMEVDVETEILF